MRNYKEKFDKKMRESFGKEKSHKAFHAGYGRVYDWLADIPIWKKLMDVIINVALWFVIVKIFNHIDPIDEGLYKGPNNLVYLAKSLPLTLAFYPIGAYFSRCLLMLNYDRYTQRFGVWPKMLLFSAMWIGIIAQMDAYAPRPAYYFFICIPVTVQFWPEIMVCKRGVCRLIALAQEGKK